MLETVADRCQGRKSLLYLVALRGLRRGEAAGVCWPDVNLDEATLTMSRTLRTPRWLGVAAAKGRCQCPHHRFGLQHCCGPGSPSGPAATRSLGRPSERFRLRPPRRAALQPELPEPSLPGAAGAPWAAADPVPRPPARRGHVGPGGRVDDAREATQALIKWDVASAALEAIARHNDVMREHLLSPLTRRTDLKNCAGLGGRAPGRGRPRHPSRRPVVRVTLVPAC
jgi:hypothetical protein